MLDIVHRRLVEAGYSSPFKGWILDDLDYQLLNLCYMCESMQDRELPRASIEQHPLICIFFEFIQFESPIQLGKFQISKFIYSVVLGLRVKE